MLDVPAYSQSLPPGATPGGALPDLEPAITEPFVYPGITPPEEPAAPAAEVDPDEPRMQVRGFRIDGVVPRPELGITQAAIDALVRAEAERLLAGPAAQGFTLGLFEQLTGAISRYYRSRGFFLARAYIPAQQVADGIVTISIVEGFLDQVVFSGNRLYGDAQLAEVFDPLLGEPVFLDDIERAVIITNDFPGLEASALFGPGLKPGSAAIRLNAREDPYDGFVSFDNHGSFYTGEQRLRGNYVGHNLFGQADRLDVNGLLTLDPQNGTYLDFTYRQPVLDFDFEAGGGYSWNRFDVGGALEDLRINGESTIINGFLTYFFRRKRNERITATLGLALKESESFVINTLDSRDRLTVLAAGARYEGTSWSGGGAYQQFDLTLSLGLEDFLGSMDGNGDELSGRTGGSGDRASGGFSKLNFDYLRVQRLGPLQNLTFRASLQQTSDLLTSLEQFSLGGPDTVRAYPVAEALMDEARLFSVEWRARAAPQTPLEFLFGLQYLLFYDYASGSLNDPLNNEVDEVELSGFGFGVEFAPYNRLQAKITYAFDLGDEPSDNQSLPFYFSLLYEFR